MAVITEIRGQADWRGGEVADWCSTLSDEDRAEVLGALGTAGFRYPPSVPCSPGWLASWPTGVGSGCCVGCPLPG